MRDIFNSILSLALSEAFWGKGARRAGKGLLLMLALVACKPDSQHVVIDRLEDQMHVHALQDSVVLDASRRDSVAVTLTWDWPELQAGAKSYDYVLKLDVADNEFKTSIPNLPLGGDNTIGFTHKYLNDLLEGWGIKPGQFTPLEVEIIATPRGNDKYVKPMLSRTTFMVRGYTSVLYIGGSATTVGADYGSAFAMDKVAGEEAYTWEGLLREGEVQFLSEQSAAAIIDTKTITRIGWYIVRYDLSTRAMTTTEPLYMIGDATDAGWSLGSAVRMENTSATTLTWTGVLSEGELKFVCHPASGDWFEPFYVASYPDAATEGESDMVLKLGDQTEDNKWRVTEAGIYTIAVDLAARKVTFGRDHSMDNLPVKSVWICGSATPSGWNTPFPEKMSYDFSAPTGTFVWEGRLVAGEIKFPCNASQYEGAFYLADEFDMAVTPGVSYHLNYFAQTAGVDDKKWIISEAGSYKITINVIDNTLKFIKQ